VDSVYLAATLVIPSNKTLVVSASGCMEVESGIYGGHIGISDSTIGILGFTTGFATSIAGVITMPFSLNTAIAGDGTSHTISLVYEKIAPSNAAIPVIYNDGLAGTYGSPTMNLILVS
jgi:uncharacterized membrane protein